ncbi:MAG: hemin uptake protein HemP, partial [Azospira oryzae]
PRVDSATLFAGAQELLIQHQAQTYRLRITAQGKLILTK